MEPEKSTQSPEQSISQLKAEIYELEKTRIQLTTGPTRVLRLGCLSVILMSAAAAGFWIIPRPIPLAYTLVLLAVGTAGFLCMLKLTKEKRKSKEEVTRETTLLYDVQKQIKEKRKQLSRLEKLL
ncbi:MAG: hypothetical protein WBM17_09820 [Anaerolineales bacterium]